MTADRDKYVPDSPEPERQPARDRPLNEQEREEYTQLFTSSYRDLTRRARSRTGNHHDAEDTSAQAFLDVMEKRPSLERPHHYLYRTAKNLRIDGQRHSEVRGRKQHLIETHFEDVIPPPEEPLMKQQREELLQRALSKLPPPQKVAVTLYEFDGLRYAEVAVRLDKEFGLRMTVRTARRYVQAALRQLKHHIASAEGQRKENHP